VTAPDVTVLALVGGAPGGGPALIRAWDSKSNNKIINHGGATRLRFSIHA
jgi:hypothetical protein